MEEACSPPQPPPPSSWPVSLDVGDVDLLCGNPLVGAVRPQEVGSAGRQHRCSRGRPSRKGSPRSVLEQLRPAWPRARGMDAGLPVACHPCSCVPRLGGEGWGLVQWEKLRGAVSGGHVHLGTAGPGPPLAAWAPCRQVTSRIARTLASCYCPAAGLFLGRHLLGMAPEDQRGPGVEAGRGCEVGRWLCRTSAASGAWGGLCRGSVLRCPLRTRDHSVALVASDSGLLGQLAHC